MNAILAMAIDWESKAIPVALFWGAAAIIGIIDSIRRR